MNRSLILCDDDILAVEVQMDHIPLMDLSQDAGENNNVASDPANADVIAKLSERIDTFFASYSSPKYNLWDGGMAMADYYPPLQAAIWQDAFGQDWRPEYPKVD